ncbi:hypothetical protein BDN72DRAFT_864354 [Pluteus cervinus]|uniref:Uncharacterized protein n=1 Tax=Pluteus cervinus TaxID=181527 RepID=A0ACD3A431_9AGAR|nr:hypothetical protein BDN72DRAFT_864354 [Pluteus cervinus]
MSTTATATSSPHALRGPINFVRKVKVGELLFHDLQQVTVVYLVGPGIQGGASSGSSPVYRASAAFRVEKEDGGHGGQGTRTVVCASLFGVGEKKGVLPLAKAGDAELPSSGPDTATSLSQPGVVRPEVRARFIASLCRGIYIVWPGYLEGCNNGPQVEAT